MFKNKTIFFAFSLAFAFLFFAAAAQASVDLSLSGISVSPQTPAIGQECIITVTVKASTDEVISDGSWLDSYSYSVSDFDKYSLTKPTVNSSYPLTDGGTVSYVIKGNFEDTGTQKIIFRANDDEVLAETKMSNNNLVFEVNVIEAYDVVPTEISVYPLNPYPYQNAVVTVVVKNNGVLAMTDDIGFDFDFEDFRKGKIVHDYILDYNPLPVGGETVYEINGEFLSEGEKAMQINFDVDKKIEESNEDNNSISFIPTVVAQDQADLWVEDIELSMDDVMLKQNVTISVKVKNVGSVSLEAKDGFSIEDDNYSIPDFRMNSIEHDDYPDEEDLLDPDEYVVYTFQGMFDQAGSKKLAFNFNMNQELIERNYENNYLEKEIYVYTDTDEINGFEILDYDMVYSDADSVIISWETSKETDGNVLLRMFNVSTPADYYNSNDKLNHSITIDDLEADKSYFYQIQAMRGDITKETENVEFKRLASDNVIINGSPLVTVMGSSTKISWETNMLADTCLYYKPEGGEFVENCIDESVVEHSLALENLAVGAYRYFVTSQAVVGEEAGSREAGFEIVEVAVPVPFQSPSDNNSGDADDSEAAPVSGQTSQSTQQNSFEISNIGMYGRLKGQILIKVEDSGKAYYVSPDKQNSYYLGRPEDAFVVMREQGNGISTANLEKIAIAVAGSSGTDTDGDGLSDMLEDAIGSDKNNVDSDGDGYSDVDELQAGYNPNGAGIFSTDDSFAAKHAGKIFLQVEGNGEAWYINPADNKRYFLGRPADAFAVMRNLGLGISNGDFDAL